jgi:hypothetical protein
VAAFFGGIYIVHNVLKATVGRHVLWGYLLFSARGVKM